MHLIRRGKIHGDAQIRTGSLLINIVTKFEHTLTRPKANKGNVAF